MKTWMTAFLLGVSLCGPARAADVPPEEEVRLDRTERLAGEYGVTKQEVADLRAKGMGWGEIKHALAISRKAEVPLADVVKLRESGMGWGAISKNYGFKLGEATGKPREVPAGEKMRAPEHKGGMGHGGGRGSHGGGRPR